MKTPLPSRHETPAALNARLSAARDAHKPRRLQARSRLQPQQAPPRRQVAPLLGVRRETVGRWLAADATGGLASRRTMAKAPGNTPRLSPAGQPSLRHRGAPPAGGARYTAAWQWLQQE